ncbi:hypothetical protein Esti_000074 [Eimeria stiedai]
MHRGRRRSTAATTTSDWGGAGALSSTYATAHSEAMLSVSLFVACGLLLLGVSNLPSPTSATGVALKRAHPLFGKCTPGDRIGGTSGSEVSFLQDGASLPSDAECLQMLAQNDILSSAALSLSDENSDEDDWRITKSSSAQEIISHALTLLSDDAALDAAQGNATLRKIWNHLKDAAKESSLFVLGLGPELYALSKIAKNVIAVEHDDVLCQEFLRSKAGACAMQSNVHIYCTRPASTVRGSGSGYSIVEMINAATDTAEDKKIMPPMNAVALSTSADTERLMKATKVLIEDLVEQQFGDVPISSLVILGRYPVAKLLMMHKFLDQSTVIVARSRMTSDGLSALSGLMRVLVYFEDGLHTDTHSVGRQTIVVVDEVESVFLLQRLFSPAEKDDLYLQYATPAWELQDDLETLQLLDRARQELLSGAFAEGASEGERAALQTYLNVYEQASRRGSDEQWKEIKASLESLKTSASKGADFDSVLEAARKYAVKFAKACALKTGLQEYIKLIEDTLAKQAKEAIQIRAVTYELIAIAVNLTASPNALEKLKDSIENACELAEKKPQLLLPALRLIQTGLMGDEYMGKVLKVFEGFKKLGPEADVSALLSAASAVELLPQHAVCRMYPEVGPRPHSTVASFAHIVAIRIVLIVFDSYSS